MAKKTIPLKDLEVYKSAHEIGKLVWKLVEKWNYFPKDTLGKQLVRAADSISINIAEGYGRYHFKENKQFCFYSRGSLFETAECIIKANERNLIPEIDYENITKKLMKLRSKLNNYIKSIGTENPTTQTLTNPDKS